MAGKDQDSLDLVEIRKRINGIDDRLQVLINERAGIARQVAVAKGDHGSAADYYRPEREADVLRGVLQRNNGPLRDEEMLRLFRQIMSACRAQQEPLKIGFLGAEGSFTQIAVFEHFGRSVRALPFYSIDEVFHEVESGAADFGVVPIENLAAGSVNTTLDMFLTSSLKIAGEIELKIEPHLNVENRPDNATRLLVVGRNLLAASGDDKTTILVSADGTGAGVLHDLLQPFAEHGVNMTRIESRRSQHEDRDYVFFIDLDGHAEEAPVFGALAKLKQNSSLFRILGTYPKALG